MLWIDLDQRDGIRRETPPKLEYLNGRYERAAAKLGTTEGNFKNHVRRSLLTRVAEQLRPDLPRHRAIPDHSVQRPSADRAEPVNEALDDLAYLSIFLHYRGLTSFVVADLDPHLPFDVGRWESVYNEGSVEVWERCSFSLYFAYVQWLVAARPALYSIPGQEEVLRNSSPQVLLQMKKLFASVNKCIQPLAQLPDSAFHNSLSHGTTDGSPYLEIWFPWYYQAFPDFQAGTFNPNQTVEYPPPDEITREEIKRITQSAYRLYALTSEQIELDGPYLSLARSRVYKDTEHYYALPKDRPIMGDRFLDEEIRRAFEKLELACR